MFVMLSSESVSSERLAVSSQRLRRSDVRKGSAFPGSPFTGSREATPRESLRGVASQRKNSCGLAERQALSAHRAGTAASPRSNVSLSRLLIVVLLTAHCLLLTM